ncbi:hypothetical protein BGZ54_004656 [Gamsiella multidivaricata]|nr:hypothetical protein BGZ54_004656 [Gamsiella multidivaricata]
MASRTQGGRPVARASSRKSTTATTPALGAPKSISPPIDQSSYMSTGDTEHGNHLKDGIDHHIVEKDGRDHHHIWYQDFAGNEDQLQANMHAANQLQRSNRREDQSRGDSGKTYNLRGGRLVRQLATPSESSSGSSANPRQVRRFSPLAARRTSTSSPSEESATSAAKPDHQLSIHVPPREHEHHMLDGQDHHGTEDDGRDHHHIRFSENDHIRFSPSKVGEGEDTEKEMDEDDMEDQGSAMKVDSDIEGHDPGLFTRATSAIASMLFPGRTSRSPSSTVSTDSASSLDRGHSQTVIEPHGVPLLSVNTNVKSKDGQHPTLHRHQGSESTTPMSTSSSTMANKNLLDDLRRRAEEDESATRELRAKSSLDREKAREAILLLDSDVVLLQKHLQEKEESLRDAEANVVEFQQVTNRAEALTREIHELEITIRDLRVDLQQKEKALRESQLQSKEDKKMAREYQKTLQHEISKLNKDLKAKEHVQEQAKTVQRDLDEANKQRARLAVQIQELRDMLMDREMRLRGSQATIQDLEKSHHAHTEEASRMSSELSELKKGLTDREQKLKACYDKITTLERAQEKIQFLDLELQVLRDQLSKSETALNQLQKINRSLSKDHDRADKLAEQVQTLKADIRGCEAQIKDANKSLEGLEGYKKHAEDLEDELNDIRDQVEVQEKHLTYLEDAMLAHENCGFEMQQLEDQAEQLQTQLREKEDEIRGLREANMELKVKDSRIQTLQEEIKAARLEMEAKDQAVQQLKQKSSHDLDKVSSTASSMRTEVEGLREQLRVKTVELESANGKIEELGAEKEMNMTLTVEITSLERMILEKDRQLAHLDKMCESMRDRARQMEGLEAQVKELCQSLAQSNKDQAAASSTASKLVVEVESLREQLSQKEQELSQMNNIAAELETKSKQNKENLTRIAALEESSKLHQAQTQRAEEEINMLEGEVQAMEAYLGHLQKELHSKASSLHAAVEQSSEDREAMTEQLQESRTQNVDLKKQLKQAEADTKERIREKEEQIAALKNELENWSKHEEGWVIKATDMTNELVYSTDVLRRKERVIKDLKYKLEEQYIEISRLNEAVNTARHDLHNDRKRRASEMDDEKAALNMTIEELQARIQHLEKRIRLDHDHEVREQVRELTYWKQTSIEQTKEWEATVQRLESEKRRHIADTTQAEQKISALQSKLNETDVWRTKAIEQAKTLTTMVATLEKDLGMLKSALAQHDANDSDVMERIQTLTAQIESMEAKKEELSRAVRDKDGQIEEMEERLRSEVTSYKARLADARRESMAKDNKIEILNSRIAEHTRQNADLESRAAKDSESLSMLENTLDRLRSALANQMESYKSLEHKYRSALALHSSQNQKLSYLEDSFSRITAEDSHKYKRLQSHSRLLVKDLEGALQRIKELQLEIHKASRSYHETLAQLQNARVTISKMVPTEEANHDLCATRIHAGEREVAELSARIAMMNEKTTRLMNEQDARKQAWKKMEAGSS